MIQIKTIGTNFKVSNGIVTLEGPNRAQLLEAMDFLNTTPASEKEIAEKVEVAAKVTRKKAAAKKAAGAPTKKAKAKSKTKESSESLTDLVLDAIGKSAGIGRAQIVAKLGIETADEGRKVSSTLARLTQSGVLKSKNGPEGFKVWRKS